MIFVSTRIIDEIQPALWATIFHDKFTLRYIKLTICTEKTKFSSHAQYSIGSHFSESLKSSHTDQVYYKFFYTVWKEMAHKPSKLLTTKYFFSSVYFIVTTCFDKCFLFHVITRRHIVFHKSLPIYWGLFNRHAFAIFETSPYFISDLHNKSTVVIPKMKSSKMKFQKENKYM